MKYTFLLALAFPLILCGQSKNSASDIYLKIKKLGVHLNVMYIAAHPDDENTRLLAYLANEKKYNTAYLSLTRGDGGQNLIGDEQGVELGMIRTYELLAARRVDGAKQFFTRAYDFGFSKSPEEALQIWGHDKILSDVVYAIRKFRPDVIICRFPTTGEGGHGHHTASAILASEAFDIAGDPTKFPEQFSSGVTPWKPVRLLWNTFNFGSANTQREDQFKIDCGGYNSILGESYGEIAAKSRSNHSSQGFGVAASRGTSYEYFETIKGTAPLIDLADGIDSTVRRLELNKNDEQNYVTMLNDLASKFKIEAPQKSISTLQQMFKILDVQKPSALIVQKKNEIEDLILKCSGLFMEGISVRQKNIAGDSLSVNFNFINRSDLNISDIQCGFKTEYADIKAFAVAEIAPTNINLNKQYNSIPGFKIDITQPFWLQYPKETGAFTIPDQQKRILPAYDDFKIWFSFKINGENYKYYFPLQYKFVDPVRGEIYQPSIFTNPLEVAPINDIVTNKVTYNYKFNLPGKENIKIKLSNSNKVLIDTIIGGAMPNIEYTFALGKNENSNIYSTAILSSSPQKSFSEKLIKINYSHIPELFYHKTDTVRIIPANIKIVGKNIGYIKGAADKIPEALKLLGYEVEFLSEKDVMNSDLSKFDAIITGIRAYNTLNWINDAYTPLMKYVNNGGLLVVQYNTNNRLAAINNKIFPFNFTISRSRVTDETAKVNFNLPDDPMLNFPNKITSADFENWIQERSIYNAENIDPAYKKVLGMKDPGEQMQDGSLIWANYGKGRLVYTGLVFFRELPAAITGAYKLFANIIANPNSINK